MLDLGSIFSDMYGDFFMFIGLLISFHLVFVFIEYLKKSAKNQRLEKYGRTLTAAERKYVEGFKKRKDLYEYARYEASKRR